MSAKPILLVRVNSNIRIDVFKKQLQDLTDDYYIICVQDINVESISIKVYNVQNYNKMEMDEFKNKIKNLIV